MLVRAAAVAGILLAVLGPATASQALEFTTWLSVQGQQENATCGASIINVDFRLARTTDDGDGNDYGVIVIYDGNETPIYSDHFTNGGKHLYAIQINWWGTIAARPLHVRIWDTDFIPTFSDSSDAQVEDAEMGTLIGEYTFDPADTLPVCASLPLIGATPAAAAPTLSGVGQSIAVLVLALVGATSMRRSPQHIHRGSTRSSAGSRF